MSDYIYNLPQLFAEIVKEYRDREAIRFGLDTGVTYFRLDELSNQVAHLLADKGVKRGDRICICTDKTLVPYVVILASLKLGATYFAVDPRNPATRISAIIEQCDPLVIFSDAAEIDFGDRQDGVIACEAWKTEFPPAESYDASEIDSSAVCGNTAAYVMFTSGSTGTPKGAVITHQNLLHFIDWARTEYDFTEEDCHTHLNPIYFDNSVFDMYSTFFTGGSLVPFETAILTNPSAIVERVERMKCSVWFSVPSMLMYLQVMKEVRSEPLKSLKRIIFGGEGYPKTKLKELFEELGANTQLINVYGPTECTCICSSYLISESDFEDMDGYPTLGYLIRNFDGLVLSGDELVVDGEIGELCLGGPCVGSGYFSQPEQTVQAFVQNPLSRTHKEVIYRTGDLVRRDPVTGMYDFAGRKDLQIKHQGHRIELEEIQHAVNGIDGVDDSAVLHSAANDNSLIIAIVASVEGLDEAAFRTKLKDAVPSYMVPGRYHFVDQLPKNANGKTDRRALEEEYLK